jgi:hypothetical protein
MFVGTRRQLRVSIALGTFLALGCGGEKSETPSAGGAAAPAAAGKPGAPPVVGVEWSTNLPETFPQDVPRYPGGNVVKARTAGDAAWVVYFSTADEPGKVAAYFADTLAAEGWSMQRVDAPEGTTMFADKGNRSVTYGVGTVEGKTQIDLLVDEMR